jgi:hypothetical protein
MQWTLARCFALRVLCFSLTALGFSLTAMAQNDETAKSVPPPPCSTAKYHQFDFWIGNWTVTSSGQPAGTNSIHPILNDCALQENWQGTGDTTGTSFNIYDQATDKWHQTWIDDSGTLLQLDGGLQDGSMVMQGQRPAPDGNGMTTHRISWTPNPDGSVRQLWDASRDGETWTVLFDGLYQKVAGTNGTP